ncbi:hypothetical protein CPB84DRAFT_1751914 [Gymnopilus junonius]|uniref:Uncharacterized protein n=1 Tax=Gymnopilus junonius TaxID=109634 RepID=A0A9P5NDG9_GYMJU|nr:hypothetical protein CPB84DRAFT_1751914 [Gymnopilus junonius]
MSAPGLLPPTSVQKTVIGAVIEGVHTSVYLYTVYLYWSKKGRRQWIVLLTISLSYIFLVANNGLAWYSTAAGLIDTNGEMRVMLFTDILSTPPGKILILKLSVVLMIQICQIWRCFNVWNRSFQAIAIPLFLLFSEIVLDLSVITIACAKKLNPSPAQRKVLDTLLVSSFAVNFFTTLVTTLLISYRIRSGFMRSMSRKSMVRFKHIVDILIQSAVIYTLSALALAISLMLTAGKTSHYVLLLSSKFMTTFFSFIATAFGYGSQLNHFQAITPTVMAARVALVSDADIDISVIQFGRPSTVRRTAQYGTEGGIVASTELHRDSPLSESAV